MPEEIRFCPNCGSTNVEPDTSNRAYVAIGGNINTWQCNDCKYTGMMPEGDPDEDFDEEDQEIDFEPEEEYSREDISYGKGYLKYLLYISIPLTVLYVLYLILI